jgi:hypothetical protein
LGVGAIVNGHRLGRLTWPASAFFRFNRFVGGFDLGFGFAGESVLFRVVIGGINNRDAAVLGLYCYCGNLCQ